MVACADAIGGIPGGYGKTKLATSKAASRRMITLDEKLRVEDEEVSPEIVQLRNALSKATSHVKERKTRHKHFYQLLTEKRSRSS